MNTDTGKASKTSEATQNNHSQNKNKSLYIAAAILAGVTLIAASFLIGRFIGLSQENSTDMQDSDTSEVVSTEEVSDVFDSTEEEIEAIKEEQEKIEDEIEEKVEEVKDQLNVTSSINYSESKAIPECNAGIIYVADQEGPLIGGKSGITLGDVLLKCFNLPLNEVGGTITNQGEAVSDDITRRFFTEDSISKINRGVINVSQNTIDNDNYESYYFASGSRTYQIDVPNAANANYDNYKINLAEAETEAPKRVVTTETYTNPYFPDFKLVYPSDWGFTTQTSPSQYEKLVNRDITLTMGDDKLELSLFPKQIAGCGPIFENETIVYDVPGELNEYYNSSRGITYYGENGDCAVFTNEIQTNIDKSYYGDFFDKIYKTDGYDAFPNDTNVVYMMSIETNKNIDLMSEENRTAIRKIIENSTIR